MYENIKSIRAGLIEERKIEKGTGVPFTTDDMLIVEARVQTALSVATQTIADEIAASNIAAMQEDENG